MASGSDEGRRPTGSVLGALLRAQRERARLTQEQLAERSGLSARTIRGLETGRIRRPRLGSVRSLADALGLTGREREALNAAARGGPAVPAHSARVPSTPRQLPPDVAELTGRAAHLERLDELLRGNPDIGPAAVVISAITGSAGVGKTALAVHWAHRVAGRFGDGQLYVDLRGSAAGPPLRPIQALAQLLRALGVEADQVPVEVDEAAGLYRSLLAGRRMLVVLDNARDAEQVRPLLPGSGGCVVVVTSRDRLTGLVASHGARRLTLEGHHTGEEGGGAGPPPAVTEGRKDRRSRRR